MQGTLMVEACVGVCEGGLSIPSDSSSFSFLMCISFCMSISLGNGPLDPLSSSHVPFSIPVSLLSKSLKSMCMSSLSAIHIPPKMFN